MRAVIVSFLKDRWDEARTTVLAGIKLTRPVWEQPWWWSIRLLRFLEHNYVWLFFLALGGWLWFGGYQLIVKVMGLAIRDVEALSTVSPGDIAGQDFSGIRNLLLGLAALLGVPFFILNAWIKERTTRTAEQGHMTDRIAKAVESLGTEKTVKKPYGEADEDGARKVFEVTEPNLEVRTGAIYALERISQDSARDHWQVMEILAAYLRENAKAWPEGKPEDDDQEAVGKWLKGQPKLRVDLQAVLSVLARRSGVRRLEEDKRRLRLDLRGLRLVKPDYIAADFLRDLPLADMTGTKTLGANLAEAKLTGADLTGAELTGADLTGAELTGAELTGAELYGADLAVANLRWADLRWANLTWADLAVANLRWADLTWANLTGADLTEANLTGADLTWADLTWADLAGADLAGADLTRAKLKGAKLKGAKLKGAKLANASRVSEAIALRQSLHLDTAELPEGWTVGWNEAGKLWDIMTPDGPYVDPSVSQEVSSPDTV